MSPHPAEPLLIVGPVTWDLIDGRRVPGGAVAYAARVAAAFGVRAHILVNAAPDADLAPLEGHAVHRVDSRGTLTYEHQFVSGVRTLVVRAAAGRTLHPRDLPAHWPAPRTLILAPLLPDDLDLPAFVRESPAEAIAVLAQGVQRRIGADGRVEDLDEPAEALRAAADERLSIFLSVEETASWPVEALDSLVASVRRVVITHGRSGMTIHTAARVDHAPALTAEQVDTTGAGDVFAAAFILGRSEQRSGDDDVEAAGRLAAAYAAANIERPGTAPLPPLHDVLARLEQGPPAAASSGGAVS